MGAWTQDELARMADADELRMAPVRRNGELRKATPIWVVRVDDDIYVRAAYASGSAWYGVARTSRQAHVSAGGAARDVTVEDADDGVIDRVDAAYRAKYGTRYASIVDELVEPKNRVNTVRLVPKAGG